MEETRKRLTLVIAGIDSVLGSELCATCPYSPAGCCVAPPRYDWSDLARVVRHGDTEWLLEGLAAGRLVPIEHGLALRREKKRVSAARTSPRLAKCTFHDGASGCTIAASRRPATCNIYLCDEALRLGEPASAADAARAEHDARVSDFVAWDRELEARVKAQWAPEWRFTREFFAWLAATFEEIAKPRSDAETEVPSSGHA